jgi:hypothetical protein
MVSLLAQAFNRSGLKGRFEYDLSTRVLTIVQLVAAKMPLSYLTQSHGRA